MLRKSTLALALGLACSAHGAWALGLGGMRTQSALNQPFYAEIDLFDVDGAALDAVKVRLASREEFDRAGTERPHFLTRLRFTPVVGPRGEPMVQVTSREPVREPYLNFFVEVLWPEGRLVKEYTVLLDPPVTSAEQAPRIAQPRISAPVRRPPPQPEPPPMRRSAPEPSPAAPRPAVAEPPPVASTPAPVASAAAPARPVIPVQATATDFPLQYGPVPPGAGLWRIARNLAPPGATVAQTAMALYRNNGDAFVRGDINKLKVGAELAIPTAAELFALDADSAEVEFRDALAGRAVTDTPITDVEAALRIAGASPGTEASDVDDAAIEAEPPEVVGQLEGDLLLVRETSEANRQETRELRERIRELEDQLTDIRRLLELRNEQLQQMQAVVLADPADSVAAGDLGQVSVATTGTAGSDTALVDEPRPLLAGDAPAAGGSTVLGPPPPPVAGDTDAGAEGPAVAQQVALQGEPAVHEQATPITEETSSPESGTFAALRAVTETMPPWSLPAGAGALLLGGLGIIVGRRRRRLAAEQALLDEELSIDLPEEIEAASIAGRTDGFGDDRGRRAEADRDALMPAALADASPGDASMDALAGLGAEASMQPAGDLQEAQEADVLSEADIYILYGRYREAEQLLLEEMERSPERIDLRYKLAEVHIGSNDREALSALVERMETAGESQFDSARWQTITTALADMGGPMPQSVTEPSRDDVSDGNRGVATVTAVGASSPDVNTDDPSGRAPGDREAMSGGADDAGLDGARHGIGAAAAADADELELDLDDLEQLGGMDEPPAPSSAPPRGTIELAAAREPQRQSQGRGDDALDIDLEGLGAISDLDQRDISEQLQGLWPVRDNPDALPDPMLGKALDDAAADFAAPQPGDADWSNATARAGSGEVSTTQWRTDTGLWDEAATKMDLARAYIEIEDPDAARTILEEVVHGGSDEQRTAARALLARIG
jgi:pilus assembly protein FimV